MTWILVNAVADLRGPRGTFPLWAKMSLFSYSFRGKIGQTVCWRPPPIRGRRSPFWKTLDPPLKCHLWSILIIFYFMTLCGVWTIKNWTRFVGTQDVLDLTESVRMFLAQKLDYCIEVYVKRNIPNVSVMFSAHVVFPSTPAFLQKKVIRKVNYLIGGGYRVLCSRDDSPPNSICRRIWTKNS